MTCLSKYNSARSAVKNLFTQSQKNILPQKAAKTFLHNPTLKTKVMKIFFHYLLTMVVFIVADGLYLGFFASRFIKKQAGHLLAPSPDWIAAGIFYLIFIAGILYFAVYPAMEKGGMGEALLRGAMLGLLTYSTYELTNKALIRDWPLPLVLVDIAWGIFLCTLCSAAGYQVGQFLWKDAS